MGALNWTTQLWYHKGAVREQHEVQTRERRLKCTNHQQSHCYRTTEPGDTIAWCRPEVSGGASQSTPKRLYQGPTTKLSCQNTISVGAKSSVNVLLDKLPLGCFDILIGELYRKPRECVISSSVISLRLRMRFLGESKKAFAISDHMDYSPTTTTTTTKHGRSEIGSFTMTMHARVCVVFHKHFRCLQE